MKVKCEYCNNYIDDGDEKCPSCGAINNNYKRVGNEVPTTIEELKKWYEEHNLPPAEVTRFFIDTDFKEPKAFGIYKDINTGKYIVYKNKDTGERKIRYEGTDEKYAVNELYLKLKEEIMNQKNNQKVESIETSNYNQDKYLNLNPRDELIHGKVSNKLSKKSSTTIILINIFIIILLPLIFIISINITEPHRGYYNINNQEYYYVKGNWYIYKNEEWKKSKRPKYKGLIINYYDGNNYSSDNYTDIKDSSVYDNSWDSSSSNTRNYNNSWSSSNHWSSNDWDSGSSWSSSGSWDSGSTDWGSDW